MGLTNSLKPGFFFFSGICHTLNLTFPISMIDMNIILIFLELRPCWMAPNSIDLYYRMYSFCFETKFLRLRQKLPKISFF